MVKNRVCIWLSVVSILGLLLLMAACAASPEYTEAPPEAPPVEEAPAAEMPPEEPAEEAYMEEVPAEEPPEEVYMEEEAPAADVIYEEAAAGEGAVPWPSANRINRMIIKTAEIILMVADTEVAINGVTQVAIDSFGYILSSRTWYDADYKYATITIGVPSEEYENALRRLRNLAVKVLDENASGSDVTDEYVDLESRLRNLEATEARIRSFLDKADTVEEALYINQELTTVTEEIEEVKGRMNYLKDRAAYSTITVQILPDIPTPTITPTPTTTPTTTPTPTSTPTTTPTPIAWAPGETAGNAAGVLGGMLRVLGDALIWFTIVLGPFVVVVGLIAWLVISRWQRAQKPEGDEGKDKQE